jgi:hypothetical protein
MESGIPGSRTLTMAGSIVPSSPKTFAAPSPTAFRALALGPDVPRTLAGRVPAIALSNVNSFAVGGSGPTPSAAANAFEAMYGDRSDRLRDLSAGVAAFWRDLGDGGENVTLVTMSEFGRTARENGTGGTDQGDANAMFVLGGNVRGGRIYGRWPGLANEQLNEGRDLALTTNLRQVLGEIVAKSLRTPNLDAVFPGAHLAPARFLNLLA